MKCSEVVVTLFPADALRAGMARLANVEDTDIATLEQAENYRGAVFTENLTTTIDLPGVDRDGLACVNFVYEEGVRVNYDYPIHSLKRISHKAN